MRMWGALALALVAAVAAVACVPLPAAAQMLGSDAEACLAGEGPAVRVAVEGLKDRSGEIKVELYPANDDDFLKDDRDLIKEGKVFRRVRAPTPAWGPVILCIRVPRPGRYALLVTHNRDGRNKFNMWQDGAGLIGNVKLGRSRPKVAMAEIDVPAGIASATVIVQYMRGLSGFGPVWPEK
ncbi:DUF2141 domain-containing protein [uncultured Sphingomonas sp.]|uniref:DUF2141 domain-containing protein n=1 Tax=uncultured Sphingomonas sp. TaxID=158754 RepID=UPI0035CB97ED